MKSEIDRKNSHHRPHYHSNDGSNQNFTKQGNIRGMQLPEMTKYHDMLRCYVTFKIEDT